MVFPFILRFLNSCPTSEATITRFFTAHQIVLGKHCLIGFFITEYQLNVLKQIIHLSELSVCVAFIKGKLE